jgi:plastocyanin
VDAGVVTFATTNESEEPHELAFLPGGGEVPFTEDGVPDEEALEAAGAFELEAYGPGQDCNATFELDVGDYTMFCIVEAPDGETHYEKGMAGTLTVG